jgi:hypothetical protein
VTRTYKPRRLWIACWASLALLAHAATPTAAQELDADTGQPSSYGARARSRVERAAGAQALNAREARQTAGTLGEPARAITDVAGVARAGFDSGELIIWGSSDNESHSYIDGVDLPMLFHPGGFRSTLLPPFLDTFSITKGAPGPEFGRGLGGVIEVSTRSLDDPDPHASVDLDLLGAAASLQGSIGPLRVAWGGRLGYSDRLATYVAPKAGDIVPVPQFADGFARVQLSLAEHEQLSLVWLGSEDAWTRGRTQVDPAASITQTQRRHLQLSYLRYERVYADRARVTVTPFIENFDKSVVSQSGAVPWRQANNQLSYGLRASYSLPGSRFDVQLGMDAIAIQSRLSRAGTLTLPAREGDISVFGQPPGNEVTRDSWGTNDVHAAPYANLSVRLGRLTITPGLRCEIHGLSASRALPKLPQTPAIGRAALELRPEPRLQLRYFFAEWLALSARAAITHQAPAPEDRSAVFGNPALELARAMTVAAGPKLKPWRGLELEIHGFYKVLSQLAMRNPAMPLPLTAALLPQGEGRSYGAELSLQLRASQAVSAQLSYTLSRSERTDLTGAQRLFDFDQTHVATLLWSVRHAGWLLSGRARLATGSPRTAVVASFHDLKDDRYDPIFGEHNALRLPTFLSLDLRLEHSIVVAAFTGSIWLDIMNLTNHHNVEDVAYTFDYGRREDVIGLPFLAVLGMSGQL